jgi:hypothetical protein
MHDRPAARPRSGAGSCPVHGDGVADELGNGMSLCESGARTGSGRYRAPRRLARHDGLPKRQSRRPVAGEIPSTVASLVPARRSTPGVAIIGDLRAVAMTSHLAARLEVRVRDGTFGQSRWMSLESNVVAGRDEFVRRCAR